MRFLFLIVLLLCNTAFAELKVFQDEYLFSLKEKAGIIAESADKELADKYTILEYGDGVRLVVPRGRDKASEILNERKVVPYKKESDKCLTQPVKGFNCEPNWYVSAAVEPTDDYYQNKLMWGLNGEYGINANMAWDLTVGDPIVVAVVDTGTNFLHPDLSPNIWRNPREIPDNGKDDDGNGFIDDSHGYNATTGVGKPIDDNGHGSHVAGTICAYGDGGGDIVGVSWNCKILTVKFLRSNGGGSLFDAIRGLRYILRIKRQYNLKNVVINNSWGGGGYSRTLDELIGELEKEGLIFVAAAGNNGQNIDNSPYYPSAYQHANVLRIGAIDKKGNAAGFSNWGSQSVDISAPGVGIFSAAHQGNGYVALSGTSMATPHASGSLALLLSREPGLKHTEAIKRVLSTGRRISTLKGRNKTGMTINAYSMLTDVEAPPLAEKPGNQCRIRRFKRCKRGCNQQFKRNRRNRRGCKRTCRGQHDCPLNFRNLLAEWFTWGE